MALFILKYRVALLILGEQLSELKKSDSRQKSWQIAGLFAMIFNAEGGFFKRLDAIYELFEIS